MKKVFIKIVTCSLLTVCAANSCHGQEQYPFSPRQNLGPHPRLLLTDQDARSLQKHIAENPALQHVQSVIISECDSLLRVPALQRIKTGRRLLSVSREALRRIFYLAYAYRAIRDQRYALRAREEMRNVAAFTDWNPSHFLDVAEMTLAMSIGYDWLYDQLPAVERNNICQAIIVKGLRTSFDKENNGFLKSRSNWNQVCNTGMSFGAFAVYEDHCDTAAAVINRAISSIKLPMQQYRYDGDYAEGYNYWGYGTSFNVLFLSALEKISGMDYGLSAMPGFMQTAAYYMHMAGPSGKPFNYSDAGTGSSPQPAMFWFAAKEKNSGLLWEEKRKLFQEGEEKLSHIRLLPALLVWSQGIAMEHVPPPKDVYWIGKGVTPVVLMRSSWTDKNAVFVGFKVGSPSTSHAHMDIGSFVMESDGERWALDPGMQDYESLESRGLNIFGAGSQRWEVFRNTNFLHNTLTVNGALQQVKTRADFTRYSASGNFAIADLTPVYNGLANATRGVMLKKDGYLLVRDELESGADTASVRWAMLTGAEVHLLSDTSAELRQNGKKLTLIVRGDNIRLQTWNTDPPKDYDAPNKGTVLLGFTTRLKPQTRSGWSVLMIPGSTQAKQFHDSDLSHF